MGARRITQGRRREEGEKEREALRFVLVKRKT